MNTITTQELDTVLAFVAPDVPGIKVGLVLDLIRDAKSYAHLQEQACNAELTPRQLAREHNLEQKIADTVAAILGPGHGATVKFSGDPRGYCVKVQFPDGRRNGWSEDWGIA